MATEPKKIHNFDEKTVKVLRRAIGKLEQSTGRFLTTAQKEENEKAVASAREDLALIAVIKTQL